jgi:hypothetical protein
MALISCPECSHRVSDQARACPACGFPLAGRAEPAEAGKGSRRRSRGFGVPLAAIALGVVGAACSLAAGNQIMAGVGLAALLMGIIRLIQVASAR